MRALHANETEERIDWQAIDWPATRKSVRQLRQRIFRATKEGNSRKVRSLQKLMLRSRANRLLSVRQIAQVNAGRHTPGVDKVVARTPNERARLAEALGQNEPWRASPARRVMIPKANGKERPLGIPTIADRAMQAIVKNALEPEWEAKFEPCSYGFRPGRSAHDAIERIFAFTRGFTAKPWVVDADIKGAFDSIRHDVILDAVEGFPARELIRQWLKAGVMIDGAFMATEEGTPQGGVISPLLANIALHGMEAAVGSSYKQYPSRLSFTGSRGLVRYADDFVIFCPTREDADAAKAEIAEWLAERGLQLSAAKTKIVHVREGFDFLGFNVRCYPDSRANKSGVKTLIKPSKDAVKRFRRKLKALWRFDPRLGAPENIVRVLNPVLRGWANYYRHAVAKQTFVEIDDFMHTRQRRWMKRRHPKKSWAWVKAKYFGAFNPDRPRDRWVFGAPSSGLYLAKLRWTPIRRHRMVTGSNSPDDPALRDYWAARRKALASGPFHRSLERYLAFRQDGLCPICGGDLHEGEALAVFRDGVARYEHDGEPDNRVLAHKSCRALSLYKGNGDA